MKKNLKKIIKKNFDIDYPKDTNNGFICNLYDVYEKAFKTATLIKDSDTQLQLADAQLIGFTHCKQNRDDIIGLITSMGLTKKEWVRLKKECPQNLDTNDFNEIETYFN